MKHHHNPHPVAPLRRTLLCTGLSLALALTACGGSGSDSASSAAAMDSGGQARALSSTAEDVRVAATRWSDPATWGGTLPLAGATVLIPAGKTVVLDTNTPPLKGLTVQGTLTAAADVDVGITTDYLIVRGGVLQIGSAKAPHTRRATLTLTGSTTADLPGAAGFGAKVLGVMGGTLQLHGDPTPQSWTRLGADVAAGARTITLATAPQWQAGDRIVIATSSTDQAHHDVAMVQAVSGSQVTLAQPLRYRHLGAVRRVGGVEIDVRAEVGRLNRNIVVQGDDASTALKLGGHAMFMAGNGTTLVQLSQVEFRRMGQLNQLGRYPLHFHLMGTNCTGCYVRDSAVTDTVQRGIVLHGTQGVTLAGNVVFNTVGHNIFVEDADTTGNLIEGNLALVNRQPSPLHTEPTLVSQNDRMPANVWFKSGRNVVTNNVAAGSFANGFIFDGIQADGPLDFRRNTAHAAMAKEGLGEGDFDTKAGVMIIGGGHPQDRIEDTLVYHNAFGLWAEEGGPYVFNRFTAAENGTAAENRGVSNTVTYRNGFFVASFPGGQRGNANNVHFQYGSDVRLEAPTFANYGAGIFSATDIALPSQVGLWMVGARFVGTLPPRLPPGDGIATFEDDSFVPRGTYAADARYAPLSCPLVDFTYSDGQGGTETETFHRCEQRPGFAELDVRDMARPTVRLHDGADLRRSDGLVFRGGMFGYTALYNAGLGYAVLTAAPMGQSLRLHTTMLDGRTTPVDTEQAWVPASVPATVAPSAVFRTTANFDRPPAPLASQRLRRVGSLTELAADPLGSWFHDPAAGRVHFNASVRWVTIQP